METRDWTLEEPSWGWPDNVDETGTDAAYGYRYVPIKQTRQDGYWWHVARVSVDEGDDEMLADARLIAAAPELLASLKAAKNELIDLYEAAYPDDESENDTTAVIDRVIAAIDAAEGRE